MSDNLISGLVSGVIVTLSVVVFRKFWDQILVPWFEERVYKDVRIEGKWFSLYPTTQENRQETIALTRRGHAITGTIICTNGEDEGEEYTVSGSFRNLILPLVYETNNKSKTDRGTITLKLVSNAERLEGKIAAYYTPRDQIDSVNVTWFRSKDELNKVLTQVESHREELEEIRQEEQETEVAKHKLTELPQDKRDPQGQQEQVTPSQVEKPNTR